MWESTDQEEIENSQCTVSHGFSSSTCRGLNNLVRERAEQSTNLNLIREIMDLFVMRIFLAIVATHLFASTQCYADDVAVNTTHGMVKGVSTYESGTKVDKYLGIPYAMPPVGDLRFKDPVPRKTWNNTWNATEFTPFCAMAGLDMSEEIKMSEDCLYLNVFVPEVSFFPYLNSCFSIRGREPSTLAHLQILNPLASAKPVMTLKFSLFLLTNKYNSC